VSTGDDIYGGDAYHEQFPLAPLDDHLVHQTPDPVRVAYTTDPRFYERHWNVFHDQKGELLVATGGSFYPNSDTAEAYAIVTYKGVQRSVRAFRRIGFDRENIGVGPIQPKIVSGLRQWKHQLLENDFGISFDLDWFDTHRQVYRSAYGSLTKGNPPGGQRHVTAGFESFGEVSGWVRFGDQLIELSKLEGRGTRDRHWGIGRGVGGSRYQADGSQPKAGWIGGNWIAFKDFAIWGDVVMYRYGDPRKGHGKVVKFDRRLRFEEDTHIFVEGEIDYTLDSGEVKTVKFKRLGSQTAYMKCGLYGGTPDGKIFQGDAVGDNVVHGDEYDLSNPEIRKYLSALNEHHCEISCEGEVTTGILQPLEPDAYEACKRGDKGWSLLD
tara:strand:- start:745 stop:1887 length:1143 start_codon:yes stop_codon:yes gene_type:complete